MPQTFAIALQNTIKINRGLKRWSVAFLAKQAGVSEQAVQRLESANSANPRSTTYMPVLKALGVSDEQVRKIVGYRIHSEQKETPSHAADDIWSYIEFIAPPTNITKTSILTSPVGLAVNAAIREAYNSGEIRLKEHGFGQGIYDRKLNNFLLSASISRENIPVSVGEKHLCYDVNNASDLNLLSFIKHEKESRGTKLFNSKKVRLSCTIPTNGKSPVYINETDYCSSLITDQLAFQEIRHDGELSLDGYSNFIDIRTGKLRSLESVENISNQLGASTIAFSSDGVLLLVRQTRGNSQSEGLLAPSGSGSLDWEDAENSDDFLEIVATGAARELVEECGLEKSFSSGDKFITPSDVIKSHLRIFGFSRMLHRGGKPEMFCVSVLPFSAYEVEQAKLARNEEAYTDRTVLSEIEKVDFSADHDELKESLIRVCESFVGPHSLTDLSSSKELQFLSFPLSHGLFLLANALRGPNAHQLLDFLKNAAQHPAPPP